LNGKGPPLLSVFHRKQHNKPLGNKIIPMNTLLLAKLINFIQSLGRFQIQPEFGLNELMRKSPARIEDHPSAPAFIINSQSGKWISGILFMLMVSLFSFGTAWSQVDLSLSKEISNGNPTVGQTITYTVTVKNTGTLPASGVIIKDSLPVGGVNFVASTVVRGAGTYNPITKLWNVGNVAVGDSAILSIQATVLAQGVFYNIAEVVQMNEQDADSRPNDGALDQDDLASVCFSVPVDWYQGDEFLISIPSGYKGIIWFYNGTPITDSTVVAGKTVAVVNQDSSLTIKGIGSFSFTSTVGVSCPASGCCAIQIVQGPIYDLALNKSLAPGQSGVVTPGSTVKYRIVVTNQGNVPATQIVLSDSLPTGLTLQDPAWTLVGNIATLNAPIPGPLAPSGTTFIDITTIVSSTFIGNTLTNYAQIKDAKDGQGNPATDKDSTPGNGFNNGEDDRGSQSIQVSPAPAFDLALSKTLAPGQLGNVTTGSTVKYRITITNQGNVPATQIAITDSLPVGLVLQDIAWTATGNIATLNTPIAGPLAPSATTFVDITTQVSNGFIGNTLTNYTQIKDAKDGQGNPATDKDSTPGNGFNNGEDDRDSEPILIGCPTITLIVSNDTTLCGGGSVTLRATTGTGGTTINWYTSPTGTTPFTTTASGAALTQSPTTTTTYYTEGALINGCKSARKAITVTVSPKPSTPVCQGIVQNICPATTVNLTTIPLSPISTPGGVFEWRTGRFPTNPLVINPTGVGSGTYYLFEKSTTGCYSNPMVVIVNIVSCACTITPPIIACVNPNICIGESATITAVGCIGGTIKWSNGAIGSSITVTPTQNVTYTAVCEQNVCTSSPSNPQTINVVTPVKPTLASNLNSVCVGGSAILTASNCNGVVYWSTGATGSPIIVIPTVKTTYTAFCKKFNCVSETASITIDVTPPPLPPLIVCGKMEVCPGESVELQALDCIGTVKWSNGATGVSITVTPTVTTTYTATCTVGLCESPVSDPHTIKVTTPIPPVIASNTSSVCAGGIAILTAPNCAGTVKWSNGATGSSILVTLNATTSFTATCLTNVCQSGPSNTVTINVAVPTAPIISSTKTVICSGDSVTLTSTGCNGLVKWSNGMIGASINVKPTATTTYFATCAVNACESDRSNTVTINVNTSGQPPLIVASKTNICVSEEITLTSTGCFGVTMWSNGAQGASIKVTPTTTTSYTAICKATPSTCASGSSNTVTINVSPATPPVLTATGTSICLGDSATITATGCSGTVRWSTGATGASIKVKPTTTTTYTATCDRGTCVSLPATITINVISTPPPTVVCSTDSICKGGSVTLLIENCAGVANWSTGETGQAIVVSPTVTTSYTAKCVLNGCPSPSSIQYKITVIEPVKPVLVASKNPITQGETTTITATGCNGSVIWSNGALGASISVFPSSTTTYSAICVVKECESDITKITITVNECVTKQAPTVSDKRNVCPDTTVDLRSAIVGLPAPGATFIYRLGNIPTSATVATPERAGAGTYYIFERSSTGCFSAPAKVVVTIFDCPDRDTLDLAVKKTVDKPTVEVGGEVTYTITLKNNGPTTATNITLIDILPPQLEYIAGIGYSINGNVIKGSIPLLAAYDSLVFTCAVRVIGPGTIINTVQISNLDQIDTKPSNDISSVGVLATGGELGSALGVANVEAGNDGTFTVTYKAIVKNYSSVPMTSIQMMDSLSKAFPAPSDFVVMSTQVSPGSTLVINPSFDGKAQFGLLQENVSTLPAGASDTVTIRVKVTPNGYFGPFYSSVTTKATIISTTLMDVSNNGFNTLSVGSTPTPARFDHPNSFGIAKMAGDPVEIENGVFDVPYSIKVTNLGLNDLTNIQVKDDLTKTFGNGASIIPGSISVNVDPGFTVNPFYTGTGATIDLLNAATSTLPKGTTRSINIMVRVDTRTASSTAFENTAIGSALGSGGIVLTDSSAEGENPDPNNDLDPSNDSDPTPIVLNNIPGIAMIGVALSVEDTTRKSDGSYNIAYKAILKNFGSSTLTNVQLVDSLSKVFSLQTGATFKKVGTPIASDISELAVNPDFDGVNDYELLIGGNSKLNPGVSDTLRFTINVSTDGRNTPYLNRVYAFAKAGNVVVTDISTNGLLPDLNGNNDPSEASEAEPTPVIIPGGIELFIPEGFSPNGDGINDVFVIRNAGGQQVTLEIYNRWMTLVYKNNDYKNDWDGTVNNGLRVGSTSQGLPDGTYFYVVKLENGRQYVRFLTITR